MASERVKSGRARSANRNGNRAGSASRARPGTAGRPGTGKRLGNRPKSAAETSASDMSMNSQVKIVADQPIEKSDKPMIKRIFQGIWSTRFTRDTTENESLLIKTTLKELITYCVFTAIITIIALGMSNPITYYYTNVMTKLFLSQNTNNGPGTNFGGISSGGDWWDVMKGPILDGLYWDNWYNGEKVNKSNFIYYENKLLGVPRLRQLRVKKGSCKVHKLFKNQISECYDSYSIFDEEKEPYGIYFGNETKEQMNDTAWYYTSSFKVKAPIISGKVSTYGAGGYIKNLGLNKIDSSDIINQLKLHKWIDRSTRVVFLDFTTYNANINLFCQIRLTIEIPSTGGAMPSWEFRSVKLIRYVTPMDYFVLSCEIMFMLFIIYYTVEEILEIYIHKLKYFKEVWNCLDVIILLVCYICMIFNIYRVAKVNAVIDSLLVDNETFPEFDALSGYQKMFDNAIAVTAFLCWVKIFKYVSFNKTMSQLSSTLSRCTYDILGFMVMFYIVFFAYVQLGYLMFGANVSDYSSFTETGFTLFRIILGDFDFVALYDASGTMGALYFLSYIFFVFFVLLNMFLAIINDTYSDVKADIDGSQNDFELGAYFKTGYDKMLTKMNVKKEKIMDIQNVLDMDNEDEDAGIDFEKWRGELKNRGYGDVEIEAFFSKYDTDGDRNLTAEEQKAMREDLKRDSDELDNEMKKYKNDAENMEIEKKDAGEDMTEEEIIQAEAERKANLVGHKEFKILTNRVDTMDTSIGNIVGKIEAVLGQLETIERAKLKRRENMSEILDKLNEAQTSNSEMKRSELTKMVKKELENWDEPLSHSQMSNFESRAASGRNNFSPTDVGLGKKQPWYNQN